MLERIKQFQKSFMFVFISGIGWLIDLFLYTFLVRNLQIPVAYANIISATTAVTFVYFVATKKIFINRGIRVAIKYFFYILYQVVSIIFYSILISLIAYKLESFNMDFQIKEFLLSKILVTPLNLLTNFLFMKWLIEKAECEIK